MRTGFKITRTDGTTRNGYPWPLPMPGDRIRVNAANPTEHNDACPKREGDGLCVAKTARGAASSGIGLASCIGLSVEFDDDDVLAEDDHNIRVRGVWVVGIFDVLAVIRAGLALNQQGANLQVADLRVADLRGADLRGADLRVADLWGADLWGADLWGADLWGADLGGANLQGADLWGANLQGANLQDADLQGADLWGANLQGAHLQGANLQGANLQDAYGRDDWDALVKRGAIR